MMFEWPKENLLLMESVYALVLFGWVISVVLFISKYFYNRVVVNNPINVAVYYTRKLIHILAGGLVALSVPFLFSSPLLPTLLAFILALLTYLPHSKGKLMEWFQTEDNIYEVHFCVMWGISIALAWVIFDDPWYGVIPISFMAFGDAITGIVRNLLYKRRTKSWEGNVAMALFCIPFGYIFFGPVGAIAGLVASIIEHFEFNPIDDNITVPLTTFIILVLGYMFT